MRRPGILGLALALLLTACGGEDGPQSVTVLAHDFFAVPEEVLAEFEAETGIDVEIVLGGDAGLMVNQAVLTAGNPIADVIFGVDTTLLSRAIDADLFDPYVSGDLGDLGTAYGTGDGVVTPIDFGDVCLNHDLEALPTPPATLEELTDPTYSGLLVVPDPRASSPGLAFLLATIERFGEDGEYTWRDYWSDLTSNDVQIAADWGTAYYGAYSGTDSGDRSIVVSYASSPPADVIFSDPPIERATTAVITDGCFRQVEYAGVLRGADDSDEARAFVDFMLSEAFQASVATSMFVFPIDPTVELPSVFTENTTVPADPVEMDPDRIEANRDRWLAEWSEIVIG
jgi:thiamine transport system substrate-binding protein